MTQRNVKVSEHGYQYLLKKRDEHNETRLRLISEGRLAMKKWSLADALDGVITNREFLAIEFHRVNYELRKERGQSVD